MPRKQMARNRFTRENLNGNADGKQTAREHTDGNESDGKGFLRKHSDEGQWDIDPADRKAALLSLPLQTHIDMVTLTLDNLDVKLCAIGALGGTRDGMRAPEKMSTADAELLLRLSERLVIQRERIERVCGEIVVRMN